MMVIHCSMMIAVASVPILLFGRISTAKLTNPYRESCPYNVGRFTNLVDQFFDMTVNVTTLKPYRCSKKEEEGLAEIINDAAFRAVLELSNRFDELQSDESTGCKDNELSAAKPSDRKLRRLARFGGFVYRSGFRCRFCNSDNVDPISHNIVKPRVLEVDDFQSSTMGWTKGVVQKNRKQSNYLGHFTRGRRTAKTFHIPADAIEAEIVFNLYMFGERAPGHDVVIIDVDDGKVAVVDFSVRMYARPSRSTPSSMKSLSVRTQTMPGGSNSTITVKLNPYQTYKSDGKVRMELQFISQTALFGLDSVKTIGFYKDSSQLGPILRSRPMELGGGRALRSSQKKPTKRPSGRRKRVTKKSSGRRKRITKKPSGRRKKTTKKPSRKSTTKRPSTKKPTRRPPTSVEYDHSNIVFMSLRDGLEVLTTKLINKKLKTVVSRGHCLHGKRPKASVALQEKRSLDEVKTKCSGGR